MAEIPVGFVPDHAECGWQPGFFLDDLDGAAQAFAVFDDGTGERLYVGGNFSLAGGIPSKYIANWAWDVQIFADGFETGDTSWWSVSQP